MPRPAKVHLQRNAAAAVLREAGKPLSMAEVGRRAEIPLGSTANVFRDPRFRWTSDKLLWLAGERDPLHPEDPIPPLSPQSQSTSKPKPVYQPVARDFMRLIRAEGPLRLADVARITGHGERTCFEILQGREFERDENRFYWLANKSTKKQQEAL